jgi:hypothetical protein
MTVAVINGKTLATISDAAKIAAGDMTLTANSKISSTVTAGAAA